MIRRSRAVPLFLSALLLAGCTGGSAPAIRSSPPSLTLARDGGFRYGVLPGWLDASADTHNTGNAVWLTRSDYGATIAVYAIVVDARARDEIRQAGLLGVGRIIMELAAAETSGVVRMPPEITREEGREVCAFELGFAGGKESAWTFLFDTGRRVYTVTVRGPASGDGNNIGKEFLQTVQW
jgi:hypothetical protein